jgi:hypothetical protein
MPTGSKLGVGGVPFPGEDLRPKNSVYPRGRIANRLTGRVRKYLFDRRRT